MIGQLWCWEFQTRPFVPTHTGRSYVLWSRDAYILDILAILQFFYWLGLLSSPRSSSLISTWAVDLRRSFVLPYLPPKRPSARFLDRHVGGVVPHHKEWILTHYSWLSDVMTYMLIINKLYCFFKICGRSFSWLMTSISVLASPINVRYKSASCSTRPQ